MPDQYEWGGEQAAKDSAAGQRERYVHGKLLPIQVTYYQWAKKDKEGHVIQDKRIVTPDEFYKLDRLERGEQVAFELDPRVVAPALQYNVRRTALLGSEEWNAILLPSINDAVGEGDKSLAVFAERAKSGQWFAEAQLVLSGRVYNQKAQTTLKFLRLTQSQDELLRWNFERYPARDEEPPEDAVTGVKLYWQKIAKGDLAKFTKFIDENEEYAPFKAKFLELAKSW